MIQNRARRRIRDLGRLGPFGIRFATELIAEGDRFLVGDGALLPYRDDIVIDHRAGAFKDTR